MYFSKVHIFFLLIFAGIGSQRSLANPTPTTVSSEISTTTEEPKNNNSSPTNTVNQALVDNLNYCQPDSDHTQRQIQLMLKKLGKNDSEIIPPQTNSSDEAVLVLGNTGVGKSSLIQFLIRNPELYSNRKSICRYLINDGGVRIGSTGNNYSFTQYPEIFNFNGTTYIDVPGFNGSKSPADEIISTTVMKKIINRFKKVKILLLVATDFPRRFPDANITVNLMKSLKHLDELIDLDRFSNHIGLIVTKVPFVYNTLRVFGGGTNYKEKFYAGYRVREFMLEKLQVLATNVTDTLQSVELSEPEKIFNQKVIRFLQSLNTSMDFKSREDPNLSFSKTHLDVFQQPEKRVQLINMSLFESNRQALYETIKKLEPLEIKQEDFKFKLSTEAESLKACLKNSTMEDYRTKLTQVYCMTASTPTDRRELKVFNETYYKMLDLLTLFRKKLLNLGRNLDDNYERLMNNMYAKCNNYNSRNRYQLQVYQHQIHLFQNQLQELQ